MLWISLRIETCWRHWRATPGALLTLRWALVFGLLLRLLYCGLLPYDSGDLTRHLVYAPCAGAWLGHRQLFHRTYPPRVGNCCVVEQAVQLPHRHIAFFTGICAIHPSFFFARLVLLLVEAANAWLIYRITGRRLLGAIYWMAPAGFIGFAAKDSSNRYRIFSHCSRLFHAPQATLGVGDADACDPS